MKTIAVIFLAMLVGISEASGNNAACWGNGSHDTESPHVSCTALTERLFIRLRGATRAEVVGQMNAQGRTRDENTLTFYSNYERGTRGGTGYVRFHFRNGRVSAIDALVDTERGLGQILYRWNSETGGCSDFPGSNRRCSAQR